MLTGSQRRTCGIGGALLLCLPLCLPANVSAAEPEVDAASDVKTVVQRALPYIVDRGVWWIEEKECSSCHRTTVMTWSLANALRLEFDVNAERLREWQQWNRSDLLAPREEDGQPAGSRNVEAVSHVLWSERGEPHSAELEDERARLLEIVISSQSEDGTWAAGGQLPFQKRPEQETAIVSTMWNALGLGTAPQAAAAGEARSKAIAAIEAAEPGVSTEWWVLRILLALQDGTDAAGWVDQLQSFQHADGGWGWLIEDPSDALGTGMALYALRSAGCDTSTPAIQQAIQFLARTQEEDGSWKVPGTKAKAKDRPVETANYWGACWAALGLMATIDSDSDEFPATADALTEHHESPR